MNFSTFATSLLQSQRPETPLFYSTASTSHPSTTTATRPTEHRGQRGGNVVEEDVLGESYEEEEERENDDDYDFDQPRQSSPPQRQQQQQSSALGLSNVVPAFVTRLGTGGGGGGSTSSRSGATTRGWKAYESLAATRQFPRPHHNLTDSDLSEEEDEEEDEGPLPGTFVSKVSSPSNQTRDLHPMNEPLMGRRTLFVYPSGPADTALGGGGVGVNSPSRELYRDSIWIAIYGLSLSLTTFIAIKAYFATPSRTLPQPPDYPSLYSTVPLFLGLSFLSIWTSALALILLLFLRRTLRPIFMVSVVVGPGSFILMAIIAFAASFGNTGVEKDGGWKVGMRFFALGCFLLGLSLWRASYKRWQELNRAILVGELACETIIHHTPLIYLSLILSFSSNVLSLPFLSLIAHLLSLSRAHPKLAAYGSSFVLFTYIWTMAMLRGIGKATTSGVVGSWYFEGQDLEAEGEVERGEGREGEQEGRMSPSTIRITQAAFARAKGPSLGSILLSSLLTTLFQTLSTLLRSLSRVLRRSSLPQFLSPLTYLIPICDFLSGWTSWFNGYTTVYVGLTGKNAGESAKEVAGIMFANRASNIRDTTLLRLLLTLILSPLTLLPSLVSFLMLSTSYLSPYSGGYAPMFAVLSVVVPAWTGRVVLGLVIDAVDTLFIATHLDAENEEKSCQKAVEAFGEPE